MFYGDVPQTWVAKSGSLVCQWVLFMCRNWYLNGSIFQNFLKFAPYGRKFWHFLQFSFEKWKIWAKMAQIFAENCYFCMNLTQNLGDLVHGWVPFSLKVGICMGGVSNFPAAPPYQNQSWVPALFTNVPQTQRNQLWELHDYLTICFHRCSQYLYVKIFSCAILFFYSEVIFLCDYWSESDLHIHATSEVWPKIGKEHALMVMNHRNDLDWIVTWMTGDRAGFLQVRFKILSGGGDIRAYYCKHMHDHNGWFSIYCKNLLRIL